MILQPSHPGFFITGTDTGVGKTTISCLLLDSFSKQGLSTLGLKPIASGCYPTPEGNRSEDAELLQKHSTLKLPYSQINPIALIPAASPNIAAGQSLIATDDILKACEPALNASADVTIIEGAGGWKVPINQKETMADLARKFNFPIVLVVGIKLGCINHALLTVESMKNEGFPLVGWIANKIDPSFTFATETIATLSQYLKPPLLGESEYVKQGD